jgi:hypothetical protein
MARAGTNHKGGRPKGSHNPHTLEVEQAKARIVQRVNARVDELVDWLFKKAYKETKDGEVIDVSAIKELLDRALGRPPQSMELAAPGGKDLFEPSDRLTKLANALITIQKGGNS